MGHATATFNGRIIAEADTYEFVEGNVYVRLHSFHGYASIPCISGYSASYRTGHLTL